jgi:plastocyanin
MFRPTRTLFVALTLVAGLSACGDTTGDPESASAEAPGACAEGAGATVTVEIPDFTFEPTPIEIESCDQIVWRNTHDQAHTSTGNGDVSWSTGNIAPGDESAPVEFEGAGERTYMCALHPFMKGTVEVS